MKARILVAFAALIVGGYMTWSAFSLYHLKATVKKQGELVMLLSKQAETFHDFRIRRLSEIKREQKNDRGTMDLIGGLIRGQEWMQNRLVNLDRSRPRQARQAEADRIAQEAKRQKALVDNIIANW